MKLVSTDDQTGISVQSHLQPTDDLRRHAVHDAITVVDSTGNERDGYGASGIHWQWAPNGTQLPKLVEATADNVPGMSIYVQFAIDNNDKVTNFFQRHYELAFQLFQL